MRSWIWTALWILAVSVAVYGQKPDVLNEQALRQMELQNLRETEGGFTPLDKSLIVPPPIIPPPDSSLPGSPEDAKLIVQAMKEFITVVDAAQKNDVARVLGWFVQYAPGFNKALIEYMYQTQSWHLPSVLWTSMTESKHRLHHRHLNRLHHPNPLPWRFLVGCYPATQFMEATWRLIQYRSSLVSSCLQSCPR